MTNNNHPITPPDDLQEQWKQEWLSVRPSFTSFHEWMLAKSAQWGADQELDACCEHLKRSMSPRATIDYLRAVRRPKSQTLASIALKMLDKIERDQIYLPQITDTLRRALEALPDDL